MEVIEVEGSVAVFLSEYFGDKDGFEFVTKEGVVDEVHAI